MKVTIHSNRVKGSGDTVLEEKQIYLETQVAEEDFPGSPTRQNQRLS
jgi:hypothetical protein